VDSKNVIPMSIPFIVILTGILFTVIPNGAKRSKELIFFSRGSTHWRCSEWRGV